MDGGADAWDPWCLHAFMPLCLRNKDASHNLIHAKPIWERGFSGLWGIDITLQDLMSMEKRTWRRQNKIMKIVEG